MDVIDTWWTQLASVAFVEPRVWRHKHFRAVARRCSMRDGNLGTRRQFLPRWDRALGPTAAAGDVRLKLNARLL